MRLIARLSLLSSMVVTSFGLHAAEPEKQAVPAPPSPRSVVVISDLHMGLGREANGAWHPREDFRWPKALEAFLTAIDNERSGGVDLVIAGDFLELWQPPAAVACAGPPVGSVPDETNGRRGKYGCTVQELAIIAKAVVEAHRTEFAALALFAAKDDNCIVVIPGNHDAGLLVDAVWQPLRDALGARAGCVLLVESGVWHSPDGRLLVEHGHQIGDDPNRFPDWPRRLTRSVAGREYVWQPWGEAFVQAIFNREEEEFPLIDNLAPSSAGVRHRMASRGLVGSTKDIADFVRFNLFDTSLQQKLQILGPADSDDEAASSEPAKRSWDLAKARGLGHRLFAGALGNVDSFARALRESTEKEWQQLRAELDKAASALSDEEASRLCDQLAIRRSPESCARPNLGLAISALLYSREEVMQRHLKNLSGEFFVYGHTHDFELPWSVKVSPVASYEVANSGAFQRLMDDEQLRRLAGAAGKQPGEYLRGPSLDDLSPCYTSVHVAPAGKLEVRAWFMPEDAATGRFVDPCKAPCPRVGHGCPD